MKIQEIIGTLLAQSTRLGTFMLPELMNFVQTGSIDGIAIAKTGDREFDLAILGGEPEGAILIEEKGTVYGDMAVLLLSGTEKFELYRVNPDLVEAVVVGCRILEKNHIRKSTMDTIPEFGVKSDGLGVLSVTVKRSGEPQNGLRVSIRKDGQMFCNDITTQNGTVGFKLPFGTYDCIVQDRTMRIYSSRIIFDPGHTRITLEI
jgi:hypothetical protein